VKRTIEGFTGTLIVFLLGLSFAIGGMIGGILGGGLVLWATAPDPIAQISTPTPTPLPTITPHPSPTLDTAQLTPTATKVIIPTPSTEDVVDAVLPSVVTVLNIKNTRERTSGSGIIVDENGYIITNAHVVDQSKELIVTFRNGESKTAQIIVFDTRQDLALLKVESDFPLVALKWGDSNQVRLGQPVMAIGSPLGDFPNSVTMGIVSGLGRALALGDDVVLYDLLQTDAAINKGNSGGPLINMNGEVVGINTFIIREDVDQSVAEGIGFAIPASAAKLLSNNWLDNERAEETISRIAPADATPIPAAQTK